ncbi:hypothetical protein HZA57_05450 [Candidatus Poribacteria bacterium]|nr:hypothetical protein [Candidatus Poribacteria bacterium]
MNTLLRPHPVLLLLSPLLLLLLSLSLLLLLSPSLTSAETPLTTPEQAQTAFDEANRLYSANEFAQALTGYERLYHADFGQREVLGNAGNAAYRSGDVGRAVLYYMRALRLDPSYESARANLARVQPETNAAAGDNFGLYLLKRFGATPVIAWLLLAEAAFGWLLAGIVMAGRTEPGTEQRSAWLSRLTGGVLLTLVFGGLLALHSYKANAADGDAVVLRDKTITRSGPGQNFFQQLELPAGTVIHMIRQPENGWVRFKLLDGRTGFLPTDCIERI